MASILKETLSGGLSCPAKSSTQTFRERNVDWPLCMEITIVDDEIQEELEQFSLQLVLNAEDTMGVQVKFDPNTATVKIKDDDGNYIT